MTPPIRRLPIYAPPPTYGHCIIGVAATGSREDRLSGRKQCGAYACRHNLAVVHSIDVPGRRHDGNAPPWTYDGESASASAPSCALDVAATGPKQCAELEAKLGKHRRRWQQEVRAAAQRWMDACIKAGLPKAEVMRYMAALLEMVDAEGLEAG